MNNLADRDVARISAASALSEVRSGYDERAGRWQLEADRHSGQARRWSWARLALFVAAAVCLVAPLPPAVRWPAVVLAGAAYVAAARLHRSSRRSANGASARAAVAREGSSRVARAWDELPLTFVEPFPRQHPYSADLGIHGRASLIQLMGPLGAATGAATLREWLASPASPQVVAARQDAARALSSEVDLREELAARSRMAGGLPQREVARFLDWAEAPGWLETRPWLRILGWLVPAFTLVSVVLAVAGRVPASLPLLGVAVAIVVMMFVSREMRTRLSSAAPSESRFATLSESFRLVHDARVSVPVWAGVRARLEGASGAAHSELADLRRALDAAEVRYSPMLHFAVNSLLMWDVHVLRRLEQWQRDSGPHARAWFQALGEAEALSALGTLTHDHPHWTFPRVAEGLPSLTAAGLAHPLLPPDGAVPNDVEVGPSGTVLLVTGSNMAGKSTLLRAIGANVILAQAGAPVAAGQLTTPPLELATCMRVTDSLEDGVSLFMAELQRLRLVVDRAREAPGAAGSPALLYLLDEILQGTNTAERQVASRQVLHHLLSAGAIGAVSTHDLELADTDELRQAARLVHFRETVEGSGRDAVMSFDYMLREGPATSANALRLVELVGLG